MPQMPEIAEALNGVAAAAPLVFQNLTLIPLVTARPLEPPYLTLDEALAAGAVEIGEVSEAGRVPELRLVNHGPRPVLLLDGEELLGAKQNRVLNLTVLVAARSSTTIPVSCVEHGRWRHTSTTFVAAPRTQFAEGRARKMQAVSASLRSRGTRYSDQGDVWDGIAAKAARMGAASETGAMADVYARADTSVDDFVRAFPPIEGQAGAIFGIDGRIAGLELFDAPPTWERLSSKLVRSYALDALDHGRRRATLPLDHVRQFIEHVGGTDGDRFPSIGVGTDVRLSGRAVEAAALVADGRVVHLSAFPRVEADDFGNADPGARSH